MSCCSGDTVTTELVLVKCIFRIEQTRNCGEEHFNPLPPPPQQPAHWCQVHQQFSEFCSSCTRTMLYSNLARKASHPPPHGNTVLFPDAFCFSISALMTVWNVLCHVLMLLSQLFSCSYFNYKTIYHARVTVCSFHA